MGVRCRLTHSMTNPVTQAHSHPCHFAHVLAAAFSSRPQLRDVSGVQPAPPMHRGSEKGARGLRRDWSSCSSSVWAKLRAAQPWETGRCGEWMWDFRAHLNPSSLKHWSSQGPGLGCLVPASLGAFLDPSPSFLPGRGRWPKPILCDCSG